MEAAIEDPEAREVVKRISGLWWLWLVFGIGWAVIGVVILQFDQASINTVGILVGLMFLGDRHAAVRDHGSGRPGPLAVRAVRDPVHRSRESSR